ncbi:putative lipase PWA37_002561 [Arxiozyma heterogenica]|uniref:putative lipase n=1 Tax=Arxiozyma heterogenica TaxID=278026 RepID=UPI002EF6A4C7
MKFSAASVSAAAALFASVASAMTNEQVQEINAIVDDIKSHQAEYIALEMNPPAGFTLPPALIQLYAQVLTYTDDSYTTLFTTLDFSAIENTITHFSWYSDRLLPALESVRKEYSAESASISASASSVSSASSSSVASSSSSSASSSSSHSAASSSSSSSSASSSSSRSAASSSSSHSAASSSHSAASSSSSHPANGAEKVFIGMGAGVAAVAALLL